MRSKNETGCHETAVTFLVTKAVTESIYEKIRIQSDQELIIVNEEANFFVTIELSIQQSGLLEFSMRFSYNMFLHFSDHQDRYKYDSVSIRCDLIVPLYRFSGQNNV